MDPSLSVVVPVYNKAGHVARAIDSVLNQSFEWFEIVIVLDPSTDGSSEIVNSYKDHPKIRILKRNEPGPGGYAARNLGIKYAKYFYIAFLDADDEWDPCHLNNLVKLINLFPDSGLYATMWYEGREGKLELCTASKLVKHSSQLNIEAYLKLGLKNARPITTSSACIDKRKLWKGDFFPAGRAKRSGDIYTWSKLVLMHGYIVVSAKPTVIKHAGTSHRVSTSNIPSFSLPRELQKEFSNTLKWDEKILLTKFANRLWFRSWVEKIRVCKEKRTVDGLLNWFFSPLLFLTLFVLYFIPVRFIVLLQEGKKKVKEKRYLD